MTVLQPETFSQDFLGKSSKRKMMKAYDIYVAIEVLKASIIKKIRNCIFQHESVDLNDR